MTLKEALLIVILVHFGCSDQNSEKDQLNKKDPIGLYGESLSDGSIHSVTELLDSPEKYIGSNTLINGVISEVCPKRGCWIEVKDKNTQRSIRIKVADGVIVFPLSAKGKSITAEGEFSKLVLSEDQAMNWKIHLASEKGIELDPSKVSLNEDDLYEYRLYSKAAKIF